jgi:hypothetical protein
MEINIGDKIRYLDAVGGGVVVAFKGKDMVVVLEEDGFETPVPIRQCIVIESAKPNQKTEHTRISESTCEIEKTKVKKQIVSNKIQETREGELLSVFIGYLPVQDKPFVDSEFECYLINDSNYTLLFNYASCSGKTWTMRCSGEIEPNSKLFLEEFGKESISELEIVSLQCIAFKKEGYYSFKNSISVEIRLDTVKFYKLHCFQENDYFEDDALIVPVVKKDMPEKTMLLSADDITKAMHEKEIEKPRKSEPLPNKDNKKKEPLEVDLHIGNLLDSTAGMSNGDIMNHQLSVFRQTMDEHYSQKGFKIVFIHGKGDGVLRSAILNELRIKYKSCKWQDASFREYGFGATMVTIH